MLRIWEHLVGGTTSTHLGGGYSLFVSNRKVSPMVWSLPNDCTKGAFNGRLIFPDFIRDRLTRKLLSTEI